VLANHVEIQGAYFSLLSGGFAHYNAVNLNDPLTFTGLIVVEGGGVPEGEYALTVEVVGPSGNIETSITPVFKISKSGDILRVSFQFSLSVQVKQFGMWAIVAQHEDRELNQAELVVHMITRVRSSGRSRPGSRRSGGAGTGSSSACA
jgi:hypothetical protein